NRVSESVLIVAGEQSGDKYGASVVRHYLTNSPKTHFFGIGGVHMKDAGVEILHPMEDLSVVGIFEVVKHLFRIRNIFSHVIQTAKDRRPSAAVLIDSPDFNLRLARRLNALNIPVLYYISPTVWAWRRRRLNRIKKSVFKMLLIFPFEEKIYAEKEIAAVFVGHPLIERMQPGKSKQEFYSKYKLDPGKKTIALLPGSRRSEIRYHAPVLVKTLPRILENYDVQFLMIKADSIPEDFLREHFPNSKDFKLVTEDVYDALSSSDLALSACGTANLECALLGTPVIAFYRLMPLTYFLGVKLVKISDYSIVNILAGQKIIPELIQKQFTSKGLYKEVNKFLTSPRSQEEMIRHFEKIRKDLGEKNASENVSRILNDLLNH
ncbi:lipid-A-disaccharide synthase, partial [Acidobacteriota bacterium]